MPKNGYIPPERKCVRCKGDLEMHRDTVRCSCSMSHPFCGHPVSVGLNTEHEGDNSFFDYALCRQDKSEC